jgi:tetratricopeptide (TPR) repeat protein
MNYMERAIASRQSGDLAAAVDAYGRALDVMGDPAGVDDIAAVALIHENLGNALQDSGDLLRALAAVDESIRLWQSLIDAGEPRWEDLAAAHQRKANRLTVIGLYDDVVAVAEVALPPYRNLIARGRTDLRSSLGRMLLAYSLGYERTFELNAALTALDEAVATLDGAPDLAGEERAMVMSGSATRRADLEEAISCRAGNVGGLLDKASNVVDQGERASREGALRLASLLLEDALGWLVWIQRIDDSEKLHELLGRLGMALGLITGVHEGRTIVGVRALTIGISSIRSLRRDGRTLEIADLLGRSYTLLAVVHAIAGNGADVERALASMDQDLGAIDTEKREQWRATAGDTLGRLQR